MLRFIKQENIRHSPERYTYFMDKAVRNIRNAHNHVKFENDDGYLAGYGIGVESFPEYLKSMWHLMNRANVDPNFPVELKQSLIGGLKGCEFYSPSFLEALEDLEAKSKFNPPCSPKIEMFPRPDIPKLPSFDLPYVCPELIKAALTCEGKFPQFNQSYLRSMFTKHGRPSYSVTGMSKKAYYDQVAKLHANIVSPDEQWAPDLYLATLKLADTWGVQDICLEFSVPYEKFVKLLAKNTSIGYISCDFFEIIDGKIQRATGLKKKDIVNAAIKLFKDYVDALEQWVESGSNCAAPTVVILDQEMLKYEIVWNHDIINDATMTPEQIDEARSKVRLFYMQSILGYMLSVTCFKPISESVRFYRSAIGVKVERGGLQRIWEILSDSSLTPDQEEIVQKWLKRGVDLRVNQYGQGDWSKYDQSLLAIVLLFVSYFAKPFFVHTENSGLSPEAMKVMYDQFVISVVQKVMYVYAHGTRDTFGCMFSGAFITSIGDTMYQMLIEMVYIMQLLKKYPDNELLSDIVQYGFIIFFFYGDDHLGKWPREANQFKLYDNSDTLLRDFVTFACTEFGMNYKEKEYKIYDHLYSEHFFYQDGDVIVEDLERAIDGPKFLKNTVSKTHFLVNGEYVYVGDLPYRSTEDIACKLLFTAKSASNPKTAAMSLLSHMRLCSGNWEAYSMVSMLYKEIAPVAGIITPDDWDYYRANCDENSARRVINTGGEPSLEELIKNQQDGQRTNGFVPKDFKGMESMRSELYARTGKGNSQNLNGSFEDDFVYVEGRNYLSYLNNQDDWQRDEDSY